MTVKSLSGFCVFSCLCLASAVGQQRVPATPLITHDPYFSIWSRTDDLTASNTSHWTGAEQPLTGIARIDGKPFRFMGREPEEIPAMHQTGKTIAPTHTRYEFRESGIEIEFTFFTPAMMNDLDILSRPVTYLTWRITATDGASHRVAVLLDGDPVIAVNDRGQQVVSLRNRTSSLDVVSVGSRDQNLLNRSGDNLRIDWGYFHLAVPKDENAVSAIALDPARTFAASGVLPASDSMGMPQPAAAGPHLAVAFDFGSVGAQPIARHLLVSFTDGYAIQYMHRDLRPYWQRNDMPVEEMLDTAERQFAALESRGTAFDNELTADLTRTGGEHYAALAILAYRQAIAAHKLVADINGDAMLFAKENFSNGF